MITALAIVIVLCFLTCLVCEFLVLKHCYTEGRFWSLVFCFLFFPYLFFYAVVDFEHAHKKVILAVWVSSIALFLMIVAVTQLGLMPIQ